MTKVDPLILALNDCESRLSAWLHDSKENAELFRRDPAAAIRAAGLGVGEDLLCDLEKIIYGIARKLQAA